MAGTSVKLSDGARVDWAQPQYRCTCVVAKANRKKERAACKHLDEVFDKKYDVQELVRDPGRSELSVFQIGSRESLLPLCGQLNPQFMLAITAEDNRHTGLPINTVEVAFDNGTTMPDSKADFVSVGPIMLPPTCRKAIRDRFVEYFLERAITTTCAQCTRPQWFRDILLKDTLSVGDILKGLAWSAGVEGHVDALCLACVNQTGADLIPDLDAMYVDPRTGERFTKVRITLMSPSEFENFKRMIRSRKVIKI